MYRKKKKCLRNEEEEEKNEKRKIIFALKFINIWWKFPLSMNSLSRKRNYTYKDEVVDVIYFWDEFYWEGSLVTQFNRKIEFIQRRILFKGIDNL